MSNYTPTTAFGPKDALANGDPDKVILGTQVDVEFDNIAESISTKQDSGGIPLLSDDNTWTGTNNFDDGLFAGGGTNTGTTTTGVALSARSSVPVIDIINSAAGTDLKAWAVFSDTSGNLHIQAQLDNQSAGTDALEISRVSELPTAILGYGPVSATLVDMTPDKGSFTGTFQGFDGGDPTATVLWTRQGNHVSLIFLGGSGTSNANSFKMTGLPSYLIPATTKIIDISGAGITNGGATIDAGAGKVAVNINNAGLSGLIQFLLGGGANGWATSGNKGIVTPTEIFYSLA